MHVPACTQCMYMCVRCVCVCEYVCVRSVVHVRSLKLVQSACWARAGRAHGTRWARAGHVLGSRCARAEHVLEVSAASHLQDRLHSVSS